MFRGRRTVTLTRKYTTFYSIIKPIGIFDVGCTLVGLVLHC